jgi:hypothetical protein
MAVQNQTKSWLQGVWEAVTPNSIQVNPGDVHRLDTTAQVVRVLAGSAWLTYNGQDMVLRKGRNIFLPATNLPSLMSAIGQSPVVFEIQRR